ncbi:MAG: hypothetical protein JNN12_13825 [Bacteroidetes Order II. Incertae sedis bacterium]|nr:hypothetical protein [Bacteroidetes Order II. bacterium]
MQQRLYEAINHYHGLISADLASAEAQLTLLADLQQQEETLFGDRPLTTTLRPAFITESTYTRMQDVIYLFRQAVISIARAFFNDEHILKNILCMEDWEIELAAIPTKIARFSVLSRMDSFVTEHGFKFVELNGESPAGLAYNHHLHKVYKKLPIFSAFEKQFPVRYISPLEHTIQAMLRAYHEEFDGTEERPTFCIVDHLDVPTIHEFNLTKAYLERMGFPCEIAHPKDLDIKDGWIYANGRKIDILYRRLLMNEYYDIKDDCKNYLEGYRQQKTCYLNTFRSKLVHKKSIFEFLTDESYTRVLTIEQAEAIRQHIPWTRILKERKTKFRGLPIDLVPFVRANKQFFVIKPNDEYGGKGVTLGFSASQSEWDDAIHDAITNGPYVVQEVVDIHREPYLMFVEKEWKMVPVVVDLDPYVNGPLMGGCLTRISSSNLANVTAGAGSLPTFILRYS